MHRKILITIATVFLILIVGCSNLNKIIYGYSPNINQGNYLTSNDISKIRVGMTQQQIIYILGTPMMSDPFGTNTWFYVFRRQSNHKKVSQQTLTLVFNRSGILTKIDNKFIS